MGKREDWDAALVGLLEANAPLMAVVQAIHTRVAPQAVDSAPDDAFPYIVIGATDFLDESTATESGNEVLTEFHIFSRSPGRKEQRRVGDLLEAALHRQHAGLSVPGFSVLFIDQESSEDEEAVSNDGAFEGIDVYRALLMRDTPD